MKHLFLITIIFSKILWCKTNLLLANRHICQTFLCNQQKNTERKKKHALILTWVFSSPLNAHKKYVSVRVDKSEEKHVGNAITRKNARYFSGRIFPRAKKPKLIDCGCCCCRIFQAWISKNVFNISMHMIGNLKSDEMFSFAKRNIFALFLLGNDGWFLFYERFKKEPLF